jgi:hypothetical protein
MADPTPYLQPESGYRSSRQLPNTIYAPRYWLEEEN